MNAQAQLAAVPTATEHLAAHVASLKQIEADRQQKQGQLEELQPLLRAPDEARAAIARLKGDMLKAMGDAGDSDAAMLEAARPFRKQISTLEQQLEVAEARAQRARPEADRLTAELAELGRQGTAEAKRQPYLMVAILDERADAAARRYAEALAALQAAYLESEALASVRDAISMSQPKQEPPFTFTRMAVQNQHHETLQRVHNNLVVGKGVETHAAAVRARAQQISAELMTDA